MASVLYQTIASFLMLQVACRMEAGFELPQMELWALLAAATATIVIGAGLMGSFMVAEYRQTFFKVGGRVWDGCLCYLTCAPTNQ